MTVRSAPAPGSGLGPVTAEQLAAVLSDPSVPRMVFQPIVDIARGVVTGYEALARFDAEPFLPPDAWFAAAARFGAGAQLESRALVAALDAQPSLPGNCFLSVNLSPHLLSSPEITRVLTGRDLRGIVIELTEHVPYGSDPSLLLSIARLRNAGAMIALDDAGSGYSGLQQLLALRPEIVKLDRGLVTGVDTDEAKLALVRMLGEVAGQLDAWVLAEGVETEGEFAAFARLGVPLAQGWLFGRPAAPWVDLSEESRAALRVGAGGLHRQPEPDPERTTVAGLVEQVPNLAVAERFAGPGLGRAESDPLTDVYVAREQLPAPVVAPTVVAVDEWDRPQALLLSVEGRTARPGSPAYRVVRPVLRVAPTAGIAETALRAMTRPAPTRFDPVVCTDPNGRYLGIVRVERLVTSLADERPLTRPIGYHPSKE